MLFYSRYVSTVISFSALSKLLRRASPKTQAMLLYLHAAQGDALVGDFVKEKVLDAFYRGSVELSTEKAAEWIDELLVEAGQNWSEYAKKKGAWSVLALLRDAGLVEGIQNKRIKFPYVPTEVGAYLVYHLCEQGFTTGKRVLEHPDWQLLLQRPVEVEGILSRVAETGVVRFESAGSLYRLEHRRDSLEGVADALVH